MAELKCPRCDTTTSSLMPVSITLRQKFKIAHPEGDLPNSLCGNCMSIVMSLVGQTSTALYSEKVKEDSKSKLWRSRVPLIKRGRNLMKKKSYGEAIVSYEKYIKLLEVVFEVTEDGLLPEIFKERMATKELTIITSVYWDLLRVYDTNEKYRKRMTATAQKLVQFAPYTPISIDIVKKAEAYKRQSRNPDVFKNLIRDLMYKKNFCFIATSVFESSEEIKYISFLRNYRDETLLRTHLGRSFVRWYYKHSPPIARFLDQNPILKFPVKAVLKTIIKFL